MEYFHKFDNEALRAQNRFLWGQLVMIGGGVCGLAAAMMLTRDGHDVTVLERDNAPVPESAAGAQNLFRPG